LSLDTDVDNDVDQNDVVEHEPSIGDTVREAYETQKNSSEEEVSSKGGRDESGKFTSNKPNSQHPTENTQSQAQTNTQSQPVVNTGLQAPNNGHWNTPEAKAEFAKLPAYVQNSIVQREAQINEGFKKLQTYKDLEKFSPYIENARANGDKNASFASVIDNAVKWEEASLTNPIGTILHLAKIRGMDANMLVRALQDPNYGRQFARRVEHPTQKMPTAEEYRAMARDEYTRAQTEAQVNNTVAAFLSDTNNYPHAKNVVDDMVMLMNQNRAQDLPSAYQIALRLHPELSQNTRPSNNTVNQKKAFTKAVTGAPKGNVASSKPQEFNTVRDALRAAYADQTG
jgi:hypothetical protein